MPNPPGFRYQDSDHTYWIGGRRITGITEALSGVGLLPAPPADGGRALRNFRYAGSRGTAVHAMCALDDRDECENWEMDENLLPYLQAWRAFKIDTGFKPLYVEEPMCHHIYQFGGTPDAVGILPGNVGLVVVERKVRELKDYDGFQLALQESLSATVKYMPAWQTWAVQLKADATYLQREYKFREYRAIALAAVGIQNEKIRRGIA